MYLLIYWLIGRTQKVCLTPTTLLRFSNRLLILMPFKTGRRRRLHPLRWTCTPSQRRSWYTVAQVIVDLLICLSVEKQDYDACAVAGDHSDHNDDDDDVDDDDMWMMWICVPRQWDRRKTGRKNTQTRQDSPHTQIMRLSKCIENFATLVLQRKWCSTARSRQSGPR